MDRSFGARSCIARSDASVDSSLPPTTPGTSHSRFTPTRALTTPPHQPATTRRHPDDQLSQLREPQPATTRRHPDDQLSQLREPQPETTRRHPDDQLSQLIKPQPATVRRHTNDQLSQLPQPPPDIRR